MLGRNVAIVRKWHARAFPAQRIHDAGETLSAGKQILIEFDPRRVRRDPTSSRSAFFVGKSGKAPRSRARWIIAQSAFPALARQVRIRARNERSIWSRNSYLWFSTSKGIPPLGYVQKLGEHQRCGSSPEAGTSSRRIPWSRKSRTSFLAVAVGICPASMESGVLNSGC